MKDGGKVRPWNADVWLRNGQYLARLGRKDEAIVAYRKSLELSPDSVETKMHLDELLSD